MVLHGVVVFAGAVAIILLSLVLLTQAGLTDGLYKNRKPHPARISFLHLLSAEIIALILLLVGIQVSTNKDDCRAMGLALHLMSFVSALWISLINVDLWTQTKLALESTALVKTKLVSKDPTIVSMKIHGILICICWGIPALVVLIEALSVDGECDSHVDGSNYGGQEFCWITNDLTLYTGYVMLVGIAAVAGLGVTMHWYVLTSTAKLSKLHPPKLLSRIDRDQKAAAFTLVTGVAAYLCLGSVSPDNPDSFVALQVLFAVLILLHSIGMLVGFVFIPARAKKTGTWGVVPGHHFPISPDGSLASISISGSQSGNRGMYVPGYHGTPNAMNAAANLMLQQRDAGRKTVLASRRKEKQDIIQFYRMDTKSVIRFANNLASSANRASIDPQAMGQVWRATFPDKVDLSDGFVTKVFQVFDFARTGRVDHEQLSIELALGSANSVSGRLAALFALFDKSQQGALSIDAIWKGVVKMAQLRDTETERDVGDVLLIELQGIFGEKDTLSQQEFVSIEDTDNVLTQLLNDDEDNF